MLKAIFPEDHITWDGTPGRPYVVPFCAEWMQMRAWLLSDKVHNTYTLQDPEDGPIRDFSFEGDTLLGDDWVVLRVSFTAMKRVKDGQDELSISVRVFKPEKTEKPENRQLPIALPQIFIPITLNRCADEGEGLSTRACTEDPEESFSGFFEYIELCQCYSKIWPAYIEGVTVRVMTDSWHNEKESGFAWFAKFSEHVDTHIQYLPLSPHFQGAVVMEVFQPYISSVVQLVISHIHESGGPIIIVGDISYLKEIGEWSFLSHSEHSLCTVNYKTRLITINSIRWVQLMRIITPHYNAMLKDEELTHLPPETQRKYNQLLSEDPLQTFEVVR